MTAEQRQPGEDHCERLRRQYGMSADDSRLDVLTERMCLALDEYLTAWWRAPEHVNLPGMRNDMAESIAKEAAAILAADRAGDGADTEETP